MKAGWACCIAFLPLVAAPSLGGEADTMARQMIWNDEFNGPAGQLPDPAQWQFDVGTDWGNAQLEFDTDRAENVSLDGEGHLAFTARREEFEGQSYTAGRIKTKDLFEQRYGRFEARIKLPIGQGIWPAFWMLGENLDDVGWPQCGEIDVMEFRGHEPDIIHGTIHGPGYKGDDSIGNHSVLDESNYHLDFHVFAVEWNAEGITWSMDGQTYHRAGPQDLPAGKEWVYDRPFFILLNLAVGGRWVGSPDEDTEFPQTMLVDWVRVYAPMD